MDGMEWMDVERRASAESLLLVVRVMGSAVFNCTVGGNIDKSKDFLSKDKVGTKAVAFMAAISKTTVLVEGDFIWMLLTAVLIQ